MREGKISLLLLYKPLFGVAEVVGLSCCDRPLPSSILPDIVQFEMILLCFFLTTLALEMKVVPLVICSYLSSVSSDNPGDGEGYNTCVYWPPSGILQDKINVSTSSNARLGYQDLFSPLCIIRSFAQTHCFSQAIGYPNVPV